MHAELVNESNGSYHATNAISRSRLWQFMQNPRDYEARREIETTDNMRLGTLVHSLFLEDRQIAVSVPVELLASNGAASTKAAKEWIANAEADGLLVLKPHAIEQAKMMAWSVRTLFNRYGWMNLESIREQSIYWTDDETGLRLKCRPDLIIQSGGSVFLFDLKTTESVKKRDFQSSVVNYGYHLQDAMYSEGVKRFLGVDDLDFYFVCVEKKPPYVCCLHVLCGESRASAGEMYRGVLSRLRQAIDLNDFRLEEEKGVTINSLKKWAFAQGESE